MFWLSPPDFRIGTAEQESRNRCFGSFTRRLTLRQVPGTVLGDSWAVGTFFFGMIQAKLRKFSLLLIYLPPGQQSHLWKLAYSSYLPRNFQAVIFPNFTLTVLGCLTVREQPAHPTTEGHVQTCWRILSSARGVAQRGSNRLAFMKPWVPSPVPQRGEKREFHLNN